jgi:AraC-like DNA-binding protein
MTGEGEWGAAGNGICAALRQLFEGLPDVYLFAKDLQGRFTFCNRIFAEKCGFRKVEDILGKTDLEVFGPRLAEKYVNDDALVLRTGKPIFESVELVFHVGRSPAWYSTTKVPVCGEGGRIVGLVGFTRDFKKLGNKSRSYIAMEKVVDHVMEHYSSSIQIETLANLVCLSISQFERKFKGIFGVTPMKYINMVRVQAACQSLAATDALISQISLENGFYDLSHFNRQFRAQTGMSPSEYRKKHALGRSLVPQKPGTLPVRLAMT